MRTIIKLNQNLIKKINQVVPSDKLHDTEEFVKNAVEEKLKALAKHKEDPIALARGMLKGKAGGTKSFLKDKNSEIEREYHQ